MIEWYRESKFPIDKLIKYYPVSPAFESQSRSEMARPRDVLTCSQVEDFEKAVADMHSGATVKPVLIY